MSDKTEKEVKKEAAPVDNSGVFDFSHMKTELSDSVEFHCDWMFYEDETSPVLKVRNSTTQNKELTQAVFQSKLTNRHYNPKKPSTKDLEAITAVSKSLFAKHVIVGWGNVRNVDGVEVPFSLEACEALLEAISDHQWKDLERFCSDIANFGGEVDIASSAKN